MNRFAFRVELSRFVVVFLILILTTLTGFAQDEDVIPGIIAFIGTDSNVYSVEPNSGDINTLTDDADISQDGARFYRWPTWSTDGRLAYFSTEQGNSTPMIFGAHVSADGIQAGDLIYEAMGEVFNYASWSPMNCDASETCRELAILLSDANGLFVQLVQDQVTDNPSTVIGRGGPFYYSWSPDGDKMLWQRNNRRLDIYNIVEQETMQRLEEHPGIFQAPFWSPVDDRWLVGELNTESQTTDIVIATETESTTLIAGLDGIVYFAWSPDGKYVAYAHQQGPLIVVDVESGEVVNRTVASGVISFFWSPDSSKIAYITVATPAGSTTAKGDFRTDFATQRDEFKLTWSVLDIASDDLTRFGVFTPTRDMVYMFTYFDQFAQSHQVWSPDSRYIVYSEIINGDAIINVVDLEMENPVPVRIGEGYLAVWSYN